MKPKNLLTLFFCFLVLNFISNTNLNKHKYTKQRIYDKDRQPYYTPNKNFRIIETINDNRIKVNVKMGDLREVVPTIENIKYNVKELEVIKNKLASHNNNLGYNINEDNNSNSSTPKENEVYYDPTLDDLLNKKKHLEKTIKHLKGRLKEEIQVKNNPTIKKGKFIKQNLLFKIQNSKNMNTEETNDYFENNSNLNK